MPYGLPALHDNAPRGDGGDTARQQRQRDQPERLPEKLEGKRAAEELASENLGGNVHHAVEGQPERDAAQPERHEGDRDVAAGEEGGDHLPHRHHRARFDDPEGDDVIEEAEGDAERRADQEEETAAQPGNPATGEADAKEQHAAKIDGHRAEEEIIERRSDLTAEPVPIEIAGLAEVRDDIAGANGQHQVRPAKRHHYHDKRLHQPDVAQGIAQVVASGVMPRLKQRDHHIAEDSAEEDVDDQPCQIGPAIDQLPAKGGAGHLEVEAIIMGFTRHTFPFDRPVSSLLLSTNTQLPEMGAGWHNGLTRTRECGIGAAYPVSVPPLRKLSKIGTHYAPISRLMSG